ncbi:MAG: FtsX-like permease family protein [Lachnospiraceae bacterium]|nr:FtsX-like permease family protein [Lachnospiraceae bacterium]
MKFSTKLAIKNIKGHSARSSALIILAGLLSASVFGGSLIVKSLRNGLHSYEQRLGADIIVASEEAIDSGKYESILLQGVPGYFYMDDSVIEVIEGIDGVESVTPQFFLASASSGCCDTLVQIVGFDPDSDFAIRPWISESYDGNINDGDVIVGCNINIPDSNRYKFYNVDCNVVAKLEKTGTGLDSAVYANMNTIKQMMESSSQIGFGYFEDVEPEHAVSSVLVNVKDGYSVTDVQRNINLGIQGVRAVSSKDMVSNIAGGLGAISNIIGVLVVIIWLLSFTILTVAFGMIVNERVKELAVLRISGASKKMLSRILIIESIILSLIGGLAGNALTALIFFPFSDSLKLSLNLPVLIPDFSYVIVIFATSILTSIVICAITSTVSGYRITGKDTGLIFRDGA